MAKEKKEIVCTVIKELNTIQYGEKNKCVLRIVRWGEGSPVLENRKMYWNIDYDVWRAQKLAPITPTEIRVIEENMEEIKELLGEEQ
jgi:hypothetical protein